MRRELLKSVCLLLLPLSAAWAVDEAQIVELATKVKSQDKAVSLAAIDTLAGLGANAQAAVPQLIEALGRDDDEIRWHASRTLGAIGPLAKNATPQLIPLLKSGDTRVRAYSAFALGRIGKAAMPAVDALIETSFDPDPLVRKASVQALRSIDPPQEKTLPLVLDVLKKGDMSIIMPALATLAEEGKAEIPRLREAMKNPAARYWVALVLAEIGPDAAPAVPDLKPLLEDEDAELRLQALVALGEIGAASKPVVPDIVEALKNDRYAAVRHGAAYALGKIGPDGPATAALERAMMSDDSFLRIISAWAIANSKSADPQLARQAVQVVIDGLGSENVDVRRAAARSVAELEVDHKVAAPMLVELLRDQDDTVVANAISALSAYGPHALDHISDALDDERLRHFAVMLIGRMGPQAASAVPSLVALIRAEPVGDADAEFVREVQFALSAIGPPAKSAIPVLVKSLSSSNDEIQASAAFALGKIGPDARGAVPALRAALRSESFIVRLTAVRSLLEIQPGQRSIEVIAAPLLIKALSDERPMVRAEAATALGEIGDLGREAIPELRKLLTDDQEFVRQAAQNSLKKLAG